MSGAPNASFQQRGSGLMLTRLAEIVLLAAAAAIAATACGGDSEEVVRERSGVRLTLTTNGDAFEVGDTIELHAVAENLRDQPLTYGFTGSQEPPLQLRVNSDLGGQQVLNSEDGPLAGGTAMLEPGDTIEAEADWDQTLALYQVPAQAPEGEYSLVARMLVDDPEGGADPLEVSAAMTVTLTGGEPIFPPDEAILSAIREPGLIEWMEERDAVSAICLYQPTDSFYSALLAQDGVDPSLPELYRVQQENGLPICSPVSVGDEWRVQFVAEGPDPRRVAVYMDIHTGEDVRYEEGGLDPIPTPEP